MKERRQEQFQLAAAEGTRSKGASLAPTFQSVLSREEWEVSTVTTTIQVSLVEQ